MYKEPSNSPFRTHTRAERGLEATLPARYSFRACTGFLWPSAMQPHRSCPSAHRGRQQPRPGWLERAAARLPVEGLRRARPCGRALGRASAFVEASFIVAYSEPREHVGGVALHPGYAASFNLISTTFDQIPTRIAELESKQLLRTATNSFLPSLSEHSHAETLCTAPKSPRRSGGHPGHAKHERLLLSTEQCNQVIPCVPPTCRLRPAPGTGTESQTAPSLSSGL